MGSESRGAAYVVRVVVGLVVVQLLLVALLIGLFHSPKPRGLPVAVVGQGPTISALADQLEKTGTFAVTITPNGPSARTLIDKRKVYGAYAPRARSGRLDIASAASLPVAGVLTQAFSAIDMQRKVPTIIKDLKPLPKDDSGGGSGYLLTLIVTLLSLIASWLLELRVPSIRRGFGGVLRRIVILAVFAALTGAAVAFVTTQYGAFKGHYLELAGILALLAAAVAASAAVTTSFFGGVLGFIVPLVFFVVVGIIAASGATSAPEFLPDFWRVLGQGLPPGAAVGLIRNVAYFDGEAITNPLTVLGAFAGGAFFLMLALSPFRRLGR